MHRSRPARSHLARTLARLALLLVILSGCTAPAARRTLTVFAAASLKESFTELGRRFEAAQPGVTVVFNFAGSQQLRSQLAAGAPADVFASANTKEMDAAVGAGLVPAAAPRTFAHNRLVVIYPTAAPRRLTALSDLAQPGLKLVLADAAVPVGQYSRSLLAALSQDPAYGPDFADRVLRNVVSLEQDVKAVVTKVQLDEADAGIVYATDAAAAGAKVAALPVPDPFNPLATYPIAPLAHAAQADLAARFVDLVLSDAGAQVLAQYGFTR